MELLSVWTAHDSVISDWKVYRTERIFTILPVCRLLFKHCELHVFFDAILFAEDVVVVGSIAGIRNRILRIKTIDIPELIHLTQGQEKSYSFFLPVKVEVEQEGACVSSSTDETLGSRSPTLTTQDVGSAFFDG